MYTIGIQKLVAGTKMWKAEYEMVEDERKCSYHVRMFEAFGGQQHKHLCDWQSVQYAKSVVAKNPSVEDELKEFPFFKNVNFDGQYDQKFDFIRTSISRLY
jgi:hypothetical protein